MNLDPDISYLNNALVKKYDIFNMKSRDYHDELYLSFLNLYNHHDCIYIMPKIREVIYNNPATIVYWQDGSKTVVKCQKDDIYDPEKGLAMAFIKKLYGNTGLYYNEFKKWRK